MNKSSKSIWGGQKGIYGALRNNVERRKWIHKVWHSVHESEKKRE